MAPLQRTLTRITFDDGLQIGATWSPDGRFLAYSSDRGGKFDIWVQQVSGGDPIQITKGPGQNWQPDWSPDGKYIAYRCEEDAGGIYITPALGGQGQQRKVASFGYHPRWSPDSTRILFQSSVLPYYNRIYVVTLDGGAPREVLAGTEARRILFAAWHPDGKRITAWTLDPRDEVIPLNFLTESVEGGALIQSRLPPELYKQIEAVALGAEWRMDYKFAWAPSRRAICFEGTFRGARNIWRLTVDPTTLQPTAVERPTMSPGIDAELALSLDGNKVAFTSERQQIRVWAFPFDAGRGRITGSGKPVTSPGIEAWLVNLSRDGQSLAIWGNRTGRTGTWQTSVFDGHEEPMVADDSYSREGPIWAPDGKRAAYFREDSSGMAQVVVWSKEDRNEIPVKTCRIGTVVYDWSPDGKSFLITEPNSTGRREIWQLLLLDSTTGKPTVQKVISDPDRDIYQPHFSGDGRWIVFEATRSLQRSDSTLYVMPAMGGPWVQITNGNQWDDKPRWSPDGRTIYYLSERKGFFNLWGIRFDPAKGQPQGEPFQVASFDSPSPMIPRFIQAVEFSLTDGRLVLPLEQTSGSIWVLDNVDR